MNDSVMQTRTAKVKKDIKDVRIHMNLSDYPTPKNTNGLSGEKCNNCGGYGYTVGLNGKHIDCAECEKTGVRMPTKRDLMKRIVTLELDMNKLREAVLAVLPHMPHQVTKKIQDSGVGEVINV
jgi:hypothetical protein